MNDARTNTNHSDGIDDNRPAIRRRRVLQTLGTGAAVSGLAGCSGLLPDRFVAPPYGLPAPDALGLGYTDGDHEEALFTRDAPAVGEVTIVNILLWYLAGAGDHPLPLGVFSTPNASLLGRSFNPLTSYSLQDLLLEGIELAVIQRLLSEIGLLKDGFTGWEQEPEQLRSLTAPGMETEATVGLFAAETRTAVLLIVMASIQLSDGRVLVFGGRSRSSDDVDDDTPPAEVFSEAERTSVVEGLTAALPKLQEVDPEATMREIQEAGPTATPEPPAALELDLASEGPFLADGQDTAQVTITATDANGNPRSDVRLRATKFTGDDWIESLPVEPHGDGEYGVSVTSESKGPATLKVAAPATGTVEQLVIPFEPDTPDHLWLTSNEPPGPGASSLQAGFNLMLKDEHENLIPPKQGAVRLSSENPNASFSQTINPAKELIEVGIDLEDTPSPSGRYWSAFDVGVREETTNDSRTARVEFPLLGTTQRPRLVDGEVVNSIRLHSLNFEPLESFDLFVPYDRERMELVSVTGPEGAEGLELETVERTDSGVRIAGRGRTTQPTSRLVDLDFRPVVNEGIVQLEIDVRELTFLEYEPLEPTYVVPFKLLLPASLCVTVWMVEGTDEDAVDTDIESMKEVFAESMENCCPLLFLDVTKKTITTKSWESIDGAGGDDTLDLTDSETEEDSPSGDGTVTMPELTDEEASLMGNFHEDGCINIYYVPDVEGAGTIGYNYSEHGDYGGDNPWADDTDGHMNGDSAVVSNDGGAGNEKTMVHEMGHLFGLEHPPADAPESNIMTQTGDDGDPGTFSPEQCEKINELLPTL